MAMRNRRRSKKGHPVRMAGYTAGITVFAGGLVAVAVLTGDNPVADELGCYAPSIAAQEQTFVLTDASEPRWDDTQAQSLRNALNDVWKGLRFNERLSVFTTESDTLTSYMKPRFSVCGQATSSKQLEDIGAGSASAQYLSSEKRRIYERLLAPELDALLSLDPDEGRRQLTESPILESIQSLSNQYDLRGTTLWLISDAIQNSPESVQFCRTFNDMPPFADFAERPVYQERLKPGSLEGLRVELLFLVRSGYGMAGLEFCESEEEIIQWWSDYFEANGASVSFMRIRHGYVPG